MTNEKRLNIKYVTLISFVAALGGLLFGYDTAVISGTVTQVTQQFSLICFWPYIFFTAGSISAVIFVFLSEMYPTGCADKPCRLPRCRYGWAHTSWGSSHPGCWKHSLLPGLSSCLP